MLIKFTLEGSIALAPMNPVNKRIAALDGGGRKKRSYADSGKRRSLCTFPQNPAIGTLTIDVMLSAAWPYYCKLDVSASAYKYCI